MIGERDTKRGALQFRFPLVIFCCAVAVSLLILKFAPAPFFWVWLAWAAALWAGMFGVQGYWPRAILFNLGIAASLLAAVEAGLLAGNRCTPKVLSKGI